MKRVRTEPAADAMTFTVDGHQEDCPSTGYRGREICVKGGNEGIVKETEMDPKAILIAILKEAGLTETHAKRFLESLVPYMAAELSGTKQEWKDEIIEIAKRRKESF